MAATTIDPTPNAGGDRPAGKAKAEPAAPIAQRTLWRAVVRTGGQVAASRERDRVEWHLAACIAPQAEGSHSQWAVWCARLGWRTPRSRCPHRVEHRRAGWRLRLRSASG